MSKVLVCLSGGLDSAVVLGGALRIWDKSDVEAVSNQECLSTFLSLIGR